MKNEKEIRDAIRAHRKIIESLHKELNGNKINRSTELELLRKIAYRVGMEDALKWAIEYKLESESINDIICSECFVNKADPGSSMCVNCKNDNP